MEMEQILALMKKYNFSGYETKVYIALLKNGKSTGYEISKQSSVPRSKVYNTLETLSRKGLVHKTQSQQTLYMAVPVEEFISTLQKNVNHDIKDMQEVLLQYYNQDHEKEEIWNIDGYQNVIDKAKELIHRASEELLIQLWVEDIDDEMLVLLQEAEQRITNYVLILFSEKGSYEIALKRYYRHHFEEEKLNEMKSRWMNIVIDQEEMMMSKVYNHTMADAITTFNEPMVFLSREYIVHDAYTARILEYLDEDSLVKLGPHMREVREIFK